MSGHGIKHGIRHGLVHGVKHNVSPYTALIGVTKDSTSNKYVPATSAEWATVLTAAGISSGGPSLLWLLQEASGNVADSIGANTGIATVGGLTYQSAVAGWTRKGIAWGGGGVTGRFDSTVTPDPATNSVLILGYFLSPATLGTVKTIITVGTVNPLLAQMTPTPVKAQLVGNSTVQGANVLSSTLVEPWIIQRNRATSSETIYTDVDKVLTTGILATSGAETGLGAGTTLAPAFTALYYAAFFGTAAEMTAAQIRTLYQTLGWTVTW